MSGVAPRAWCLPGSTSDRSPYANSTYCFTALWLGPLASVLGLRRARPDLAAMFSPSRPDLAQANEHIRICTERNTALEAEVKALREELAAAQARIEDLKATAEQRNAADKLLVHVRALAQAVVDTTTRREEVFPSSSGRSAPTKAVAGSAPRAVHAPAEASPPKSAAAAAVASVEKGSSSLELRGLALSHVPSEVVAVIGANHGGRLREVDFAGNDLSVLPSALFDSGTLRLDRLSACRNRLCALPAAVAKAKVSRLFLSRNELTRLVDVPIEVEVLDASRNYLTTARLGKQPKLEKLDLGYNSLEDLDGALPALRELNLSFNRLAAVPAIVGSPAAGAQLESLHLRGNALRDTGDLSHLCALTDLDISANHLERLSETIGSAAKLRYLRVQENKLRSLPDSVWRLPHLLELFAAANDMDDLGMPAALERSSLTELSLASNALASLPAAMAALSSVTFLDLSYNRLRHVDAQSAAVAGVGDARGVRLRSLASAMPALRQLRLGGNQLASFPASLGACVDLEELSLSDNPGVCKHLGDTAALRLPDKLCTLEVARCGLGPDDERALSPLLRKLATAARAGRMGRAACPLTCFPPASHTHARARTLASSLAAIDLSDKDRAATGAQVPGPRNVPALRYPVRLACRWADSPAPGPPPMQAAAAAGRGRRRVMDDRHVIISGEVSASCTAHVVILADAFGGCAAADAVVADLPDRILGCLAASGDDVGAEAPGALARAFRQCQELLSGHDELASAGAAVTAVLILDERMGASARRSVLCGNVGDSAAIAVRLDPAAVPTDVAVPGKALPDGVLVRLTAAHVGLAPAEERRISSVAGGAHRVDEDGRVNGTMRLSRALGCTNHHPPLCAEPSVRAFKMDAGDRVAVVLGSDGLWDVVPPEFACRCGGPCTLRDMPCSGARPWVPLPAPDILLANACPYANQGPPLWLVGAHARRRGRRRHPSARRGAPPRGGPECERTARPRRRLSALCAN